MKKSLIIVTIIILSAILLRFLYSVITGYLIGKKMSVAQVADVKVQKVETKKITPVFEASGRVEAQYQVNIIARVSGYLQKSYFKEGSKVKKGDTLFLIEPAQYQNAASVSNADIKEIQAQLSYANKQLTRAKELVKQDYIAKSRYDELLAQRDSLVAKLNAAYSQHKDTQRNLSYTNIKSPIDGKVGVIDVSVGNYVDASTGNLTTINSIDPVYVTFSLSAQDYNILNFNDENKNTTRKTEIYFSDGKKYKFEGVQDFTDNKIEETTGTVMFRATFPNPEEELLHGEFVTVKIYANNPSDIPVIPVTAVMQNQEGQYVYKLEKNNIPQIVYIKTGDQYDGNWIVKSGLKQGDRIITEGTIKVTPGAKIHITK